MATRFDRAIADEIIASFDARPEMLVQILNAFVARYSHISEEAMRHIADALNLSRADVHGVVSFYHDFRTHPAGETVVRICQAEACQAMGARELTAEAERMLEVEIHQTTGDGKVTLEPVYCLGNCACSPAVMVNERVYGRVDSERLAELLSADGAREQ